MTAPDDINDIGAIWTKTKTSLRNHLDYQRKRLPSWRGVELVLFLEVDCIHVDEIPTIGSDKRRQYNELRHIPFDAQGTLWVVTAHGLLHTGPDVSVDEVWISLTDRLFPNHKQVFIEQMTDKKAVHTSINGITNYALKRKCETTFVGSDVLPPGPMKVSWSPKQIVEFALWQERFSRGFQSLMMKFGLRGSPIHSLTDTADGETEFSGSSMPLLLNAPNEHQPPQGPDKYTDKDVVEAERAEVLNFREWSKRRDQVGATTGSLGDAVLLTAATPSPSTGESLYECIASPAASNKTSPAMAKHRLIMKEAFASASLNNHGVRLSGCRFRTMGELFRAMDTSPTVSG